MKALSYLVSAYRTFFDRSASASTQARPVKHWEEALDASIAVLAVFAWLAAMTLLP
jgi:hypothetical protein